MPSIPKRSLFAMMAYIRKNYLLAPPGIGWLQQMIQAFAFIRQCLINNISINDPRRILVDFFGVHNKTLINALLQFIVSLDHIAFLFPTETNLFYLQKTAAAFGFCTQPQCFLSTVIAQELGTLLGVPLLPTYIFKAYAQQNNYLAYGIEVFIPQTPSPVVSRWIEQGIASHVAFKVKGKQALQLIRHLGQQLNCLSAIKGNDRFSNAEEGVKLLYFKTYQAHSNVKLEFIYYD